MPQQQNVPHLHNKFLEGGGEMGQRMRTNDWSSFALGPPENWPAQLKQMTGTMLRTPSPALICWGEQLLQFYNDAFRPILGSDKHPQALGTPVFETYAEAWPTLEPLFLKVMAGESVAYQDFKLSINRNGWPEEVYFDFSYTPIVDENGDIRGVSVICTETTAKVNAIRHLSDSEERFRTMAESSDVLIAMADKNGRAVYFNRAWIEMTGKTESELLEFGWAELIHPDDKAGWLPTFLKRQSSALILSMWLTAFSILPQNSKNFLDLLRTRKSPTRLPLTKFTLIIVRRLRILWRLRSLKG